MNTEAKDLLLDWHKQVSEFGKGHYKSATSCRVFNYALGIPLVLITTFIATEFFANLKIMDGFSESPTIENMKNPIFMIVSFFTIIAPILAALQSFLRFPERANQHRQAAIEFGKLEKEIDKTIVFPPKTDDEIKEKVEQIQSEEARISSEAPSVGKISLKKAKKAILKERLKTNT